MKKLPVYFFVIAFFYCTSVTAQEKYTTVNKTHELAPVKISFSFLNMENILTPVTAGFLIEGQLMDKLHYTVNIRQGYIRNFLIPKTDLITTQRESKGTVIEAGADWVFRDIIKTGKVKVTTSSDNDGTYISEKYFRAACDVRKYWAISGGIMNYTRPKYVNSDSAEYIISGNQDIKAPRDKFTHFNQGTFGFYAGIVHRKIKKATVTTGIYGYRRFYSTKFYAQVLVGTTKIDEIVYNNKNYRIDNAKQMPIGYRIGWQWDQMGVVTGFEFGKMPGVYLDVPTKKDALSQIFSHNSFLNFFRVTFHYNIYNADRNYHMKKR